MSGAHWTRSVATAAVLCPPVPGVWPQRSDEWLGLLAGRADIQCVEAEQCWRLMTLWYSTSFRKQAHVSAEDLLCVLFFMLHDLFFLFKLAVNRGSEEEKARFYWLPRRLFLCFLF